MPADPRHRCSWGVSPQEWHCQKGMRRTIRLGGYHQGSQQIPGSNRDQGDRRGGCNRHPQSIGDVWASSGQGGSRHYPAGEAADHAVVSGQCILANPPIWISRVYCDALCGARALHRSTIIIIIIILPLTNGCRGRGAEGGVTATAQTPDDRDEDMETRFAACRTGGEKALADGLAFSGPVPPRERGRTVGRHRRSSGQVSVAYFVLFIRSFTHMSSLQFVWSIPRVACGATHPTSHMISIT